MEAIPAIWKMRLFLFPEMKGHSIERYTIDQKHEIKDFLPTGAALAIFAWIPFYWIDYIMQPESYAILALFRTGLPLAGLLLFVGARSPKVLEHSAAYGIGTLLILHVLVVCITLVAKNAPGYLAGYLIAILITALFPLPFLTIAATLFFSCLLYFSLMMLFFQEATGSFSPYDSINFGIALLTACVASFFNEKLRIRAWLREQDIERTQSELALRMQAVDNDLSLARAVQQNLLPSIFPENRFVEFKGLYRSMEKVGGDFYDIVGIGQHNEILEAGSSMNDVDSFLLIIADAAGHGVSAALMSTMARMAFHHAMENGLRDPAHIMQFINQQTCRYLLAEHYLTGAIARIDSNRISYSLAGHRAPLFRTKDGIQLLESEDIMLGMFSDISFEQKEATLTPGDAILFYTDGIVELRNKDNLQFSQEKLMEMFSEKGADSSLLSLLEKEALRYAGLRPIDDDITLLQVRIKDTLSTAGLHSLREGF